MDPRETMSVAPSRRPGSRHWWWLVAAVVVTTGVLGGVGAALRGGPVSGCPTVSAGRIVPVAAESLTLRPPTGVVADLDGTRGTPAVPVCR